MYNVKITLLIRTVFNVSISHAFVQRPKPSCRCLVYKGMYYLSHDGGEIREKGVPQLLLQHSPALRKCAVRS